LISIRWIVQRTHREKENTMEKKPAVSAREKWEPPTFAEIRVSAEVTAYVAILDGAY
jgi:coenzyme PQQ precursor peptide PqqA